MIELLRPHLAAYARARGLGGADDLALACLDDSKGATQGSILLVFDAGTATPSLIAKAAPLGEARLREGRPIYEVEYENLERLEQAGMNSAERTTPEPLGMWNDDGVLITFQSALPGDLMKNVRGRKLFAPAAAPVTVERVLSFWRRMQGALGMQRTRIDEALYDTEFLAALRRFENRYVLAADERRLLDQRFREDRRLLGQSLPFQMRHGDFCPANIMVRPGSLSVFDWEFPLRHRFPLADLFHFFAATRFPFSGLRGESTHFDSFVAVFWGRSPFSELARRVLRQVAVELEITPDLVQDLFVMSLVEMANLKYDGLLEVNRIDPDEPGPAAGTDAEKRERWLSLGASDKDVPFARIRDCACENTRFVARQGLPEF